MPGSRWPAPGPDALTIPSTTAGRRAAFEMRSTSPTMIQLASSDEPPAARNGVVRPVSGSTRVTPPITTNTCHAMVKARPEASTLPNASRTPRAARIMRVTSRKYRTSTAARPTKPSSSPMAVRIMSEKDSGTWVGLPAPRPVPISPPEAIANRPWTTW